MRRCYHLPTEISVPEGIPAQERRRLNAVVVAAIGRAVRDAAPGETARPPAGRPEPRERVLPGPGRDTYALPSYGDEGKKVGIPVAGRDPANPRNTLTADEVYKIWQDYWVARHVKAAEHEYPLRTRLEKLNPVKYREARERFDLGFRDEFGSEYEAAADELDLCRTMTDLQPEVQVWIAAARMRGPLTFAEVNVAALDIARGMAVRQMFMAPLVMGLLGSIGAARQPPSRTNVGKLPTSPEVSGPRGASAPAVKSPPRSAAGSWFTRNIRNLMARTMIGVAEAEPATGLPTGTPAAIGLRQPAAAGRQAPARPAAIHEQSAATGQAPAAAPVVKGAGPVLRAETPVASPARVAAEIPASGPDVLTAGPALAARPAPAAASPPRVSGEEVWAELSDGLSTTTPLAVVANEVDAATTALAGGLIGAQGQPGTADLALQRHVAAPAVRGVYRVTGAAVQSAHVGPTSFLRDVDGYSRGQASTILLPAAQHRILDAYWKTWAIRQRQAGRTTCTVAELRRVMHEAIDQTGGLLPGVRNTLAWVLDLELQELNLAPTDLVPLPYANIPPQ